MSLVRAELRRLFKRRITRYMLAFLILVLGAILVTVSFTSHKIGPAERAEAVAAAQRDLQEQAQFVEQDRAQCETLTEAQRFERYGPGFTCDAITPPPPQSVDAEWFLPYQFDFREQFGVFIAVLAGILTLVGFIIGASYVGAEWSSGGMTNLLLWQPRRMRVLLTKLGVLVGTVVGLAVVLGAVWTAAFWAIARYDGVTGKMTSGAWQSLALDGLRGVALAAAMAAAAFGLASIGRHTAMALGAAVAVGVISEIGIRIVMGIAGAAFPDRYSLSVYVAAWFEKRITLENFEACNFSAGECKPDQWVVTYQHSALLFGVATAVILAAAFWTMRNRDIT